MLGRPYHHDPGLNHEIMEEFQKLGYPIFSQNTLPLDEDMLERLFGEEVRAGIITHPLDITDAWKNSYSCSTNHKVWAAKFTARHPNLVALEISSFKCGHDAPIYGVIEGIIEQSGRRISASKIWMRTSRRARSGFAWRPSITSCGAIARRSSRSARRTTRSKRNWRRWKNSFAGSLKRRNPWPPTEGSQAYVSATGAWIRVQSPSG
jgi:hypothetical protein